MNRLEIVVIGMNVNFEGRPKTHQVVHETHVERIVVVPVSTTEPETRYFPTAIPEQYNPSDRAFLILIADQEG